MTAWTVQGRFGPELWRRDAVGFAVSEVGEEPVDGPVDAALLERLGARDTACAHAGPMPGAFRFCPECGTALAGAPAVDRSPPWSPPFGAGDGLPDVEVSGWPDPASHDEIGMPPSSAIGLAVAGTPSRLLCCDRASGWVSAFSLRDSDWHRLVQVPACAALPRWSWSAVATPDGLAVPTKRGPAWIGLRGALRAEIVLAEAPCVPIGGAARIGNAVMMPVVHQGVLALAVLGGDGWDLSAVEQAPVVQDPFCAPVTATDAGFWCGPTGQLAVRSTADGLEARFLPWMDGVEPLADLRPVVGRDGTLHALCRLDQATLVHEALALPGHPRGRRIARFYTPGTGRAVFRETTRLRLPWDERAVCDYPLPDDRFLYPLLALGGDRFVLAVCSDRARLGAFLGDPLFGGEPEQASLVCTLMFSRGPRMLEPLDCVLRAHRASDLTAVLHDGHLLVHGAVENRCHHWVLRDAR